MWVRRQTRMSNIKLLAALALLTTLGVSGMARSEVTMDKLAAGERSGIATARTVIVRDEAAWQAL